MTHTRITHRPRALTLTAAALVAALALTAASPADAGIFKAGAKFFFPVSGDGTVKSAIGDQSLAGGVQKREEDFNEGSALGFGLYGTLGLIPFLDAGLSFSHIPGLKMNDFDKVSYELGSQTDLNLRLGTSIPTGLVDLILYAEGGLTLFGLGDAEAPEACSDGGVSSSLCQLYQTDSFEDKTEPLGFNAGGGIAVRYGVVPFFGLTAGLDFQFYQVQLFNGTQGQAPNLNVLTEDLTATRLRLSFGVDFDL